MEKGTLNIHSENILPIIKKWLYTDRDIFARELVSNSCDAIQKLKLLIENGEAAETDAEFRIDITVDKEKKTLCFADNGIGMDAEEVKKYIAQIAFSGAEEFVAKYRSNLEQDQIIGHFGLGFYSAYMVASRVELQTLSYREGAEPVVWECDGSAEYKMGTGSRTDRGTEVILFIAEDHQECLDSAHLKKILTQFCSFLPIPIYLNGERINKEEPLWIKPPSECSSEDYLKFYQTLYPFEEEPLFWVHLNVDYPFRLKGILYFPKIQREMDLSKNHVSLYCNRVFVSDECKDLIPRYLTILKGVIDSPDIPLNVSRSTLQMDKTVRQLAGHISKKVSDSLASLYKSDRERFIKCWRDVELIVKLAILEDEKFYERAKEFLIWRQVGGDWTTLSSYLEAYGEKTKNKIFYTLDTKHSAQILALYEKQSIPVLAASASIDTYLIHFLEGKLAPAIFQRIDAGIEETMLDKEREKTLLDVEGKTEASKLADFIQHKLGREELIVEAKSLTTDHLPGLILIDEKERRMRDYLARMQPEEQGWNRHLVKQKFVVNTNNPFVGAVQKLDRLRPELAKELTEQIYQLALLSQGEMESKESIGTFIEKNTRLLEALTQELLKKDG